MKTLRLIGTGLFAVLLCCAFVSCSGDDEDDPNPPGQEVPAPDGDGDTGQGGGDSSEDDAIQGEGGVNAGNAKTVDLGLPSGTLWADRNIGADSPEDYGDYFAWGETEPKSTYRWSAYKWYNGSSFSMTKYCTNGEYGYNGFIDNKITLEPSDDAATANWGAKWCMPTSTQCEELLYKCTWTWTTQNSVTGYKVTGPNGKSIFLPAAGYCDNSGLHDAGSLGRYWSSSLDDGYPNRAYCLYFYSDNHRLYSNYRSYGCAVRAVVK